jgi:hypothetical protein
MESWPWHGNESYLSMCALAKINVPATDSDCMINSGAVNVLRIKSRYAATS